MEELIQTIEKMKTSRVANYVIAGLDSYLLENGTVRLFKNSRRHQDSITPHSHRFDFTCMVLEGYVINRIWTECSEDEGDFFEVSLLTYGGKIGSHTVKRESRSFWRYTDKRFAAGEIYSMTADEVHSIEFSRNAKVLFFEGPELLGTSIIIEPVVNGEVIRTYQKLDYMFKRI